jgi:beta-1,4-mannosyl-glycoprotein beta-1,4-N-acetylglucosaminyltransferase
MSKVYDCFLFSYGLDLLEIRLNVLNEVVDKFVIVEATHNWHGMFKGLLFAQPENLKRFEKFLHKIEYIVVTDLPPYDGVEGSTDEGPALKIETINRDAIARGLRDADDEDIILISDFDEIPRPEIVQGLKDKARNIVNVFKMAQFSYRLNMLAKTKDSYTTVTVAARKKILDSISVSDLRWQARNSVDRSKSSLPNGSPIEIIDHGGWHFSWIGDEEFINKKLDGYRHEQFRSPEMRSVLIDEYKYSASQKEVGLYINVNIDNYFPKYLVENQDKFTHLVSTNTVDTPVEDLVNSLFIDSSYSL